MLTRIPAGSKAILASLFSRLRRPPLSLPRILRRVVVILTAVSYQTVAGGIGDLLNKAEAARAGGKLAESELLYRQVLAEHDPRGEGRFPETVTVLTSLAEIFHLTGRDHEAQVALQRVLRIQESTLPPDHPAMAITLNNLAEVYRSRERFVAADPLYRRALRIFEAVLGQDHPWVARVLNNLASLKVATGHYREAGELLRRALALSEKAGGESSQLAAILNNLAICAIEQNKLRDAEPYLVRALHIYGSMREHRDALANQVLEHYLFVLRRTGRAAQADQMGIHFGGASEVDSLGQTDRDNYKQVKERPHE